ncbi:ectoine/hydroxyectoine ABC transporter solute-binding protein [Desulfosporosinus orientis DSM 765]|uniref:Ectoine/hydroxyectoine ABC transporter solute-binding protein n=1 Tax=Desulfosporosinus orientis (strain ATCC 19365 / DSM 765 / NCIMB 8382 / VKM B-1628 / Singapore I) TaxID=768706 RepID=G7WF45_DESOD|nr:ectoine/hydroxyectoine ABC transporter substrate-binding protein EhuB [Desulfosporosinus orientis]AET67656.1 ectoine/hydroxyectoine ABC transporter solute-binding protein [Desulfosporosinus orientis DSM 765]
MKKFKGLIAAALALSLLGLAGCGAADTDTKAKTTLEKAKEQGYVVVGFANEKPYAYQTPDGKLTGEAVEVARAALKNMGIDEMKGELTEFASLIPGLNAKRFDMITAGMFINPDRAKEVDFANPEYSIGEAIAVKKGNPLDIHSYADIAANSDVTIAVPGGAIEYDYLLKSGVPLKQIMTVPDMPAALSALQSGRADALTATGPSVQATLETANNPDLERVMDFVQPVIDGKEVKGYGATAFRKEDKDFREAFNAELQKLKDSGELLKIIEPFGFTEQELPGDKTAEVLSK